MPLPAPLLDDSKYRTATTQHLMYHTNRNRPYSSGMLTSYELGIQNKYMYTNKNISTIKFRNLIYSLDF